MPGRRVLLTSPLQPIGGCSPDVYSWNKTPGAVRLFLSFLSHPGLCFLGANLPVETLEYPSRQDFERALETPPDVLGISFHINESEIALTMAQQARARGVKEVWAGNYGAYNPEIAWAFDRVFTGWSEHAVAQALGLDATPREIVHPELYGVLGTSFKAPVILSGTLYTSRGCPWTCNFCQTPDFYGKPAPIPLAEIERIVRATAGYGKVAVLDNLVAQHVAGPDHVIYTGDGSSDIHVMLHINARDGLTIAVSETRNVSQIAKRTVLSTSALAVLAPILEEVAGWERYRIRSFFEANGMLIQEWERVRTDWLTLRPAAEPQAEGLEVAPKVAKVS